MPLQGNTTRPPTPKKNIGNMAMCMTALSFNRRNKATPIKNVILAGAQALNMIHSTNLTFNTPKKNTVL